MTIAIWFVLIVLATVATLAGRIDVALLCAGGKTLLVGIEFMELRHAARVHAAAFVAWATAMTALLLLMLT